MATHNVCLGLPESRAPRGLHVPVVNQHNSRFLDIERLPIGRMFDKQHWSSLQSTPDLQNFDPDSRTYEKAPNVRTATMLGGLVTPAKQNLVVNIVVVVVVAVINQ